MIALLSVLVGTLVLKYAEFATLKIFADMGGSFSMIFSSFLTEIKSSLKSFNIS